MNRKPLRAGRELDQHRSVASMFKLENVRSEIPGRYKWVKTTAPPFGVFESGHPVLEGCLPQYSLVTYSLIWFLYYQQRTPWVQGCGQLIITSYSPADSSLIQVSGKQQSNGNTFIKHKQASERQHRTQNQESLETSFEVR